MNVFSTKTTKMKNDSSIDTAVNPLGDCKLPKNLP
jgi:hypothetical protein